MSCYEAHCSIEFDTFDVELSVHVEGEELDRSFYGSSGEDIEDAIAEAMNEAKPELEQDDVSKAVIDKLTQWHEKLNVTGLQDELCRQMDGDCGGEGDVSHHEDYDLEGVEVTLEMSACWRVEVIYLN
jgi:hypothetical protein